MLTEPSTHHLGQTLALFKQDIARQDASSDTRASEVKPLNPSSLFKGQSSGAALSLANLPELAQCRLDVGMDWWKLKTTQKVSTEALMSFTPYSTKCCYTSIRCSR